MWDFIIGRLPTKLILINAVFSLLIPLGIYKVNKVLHKFGDPPWKKNQNSK